MLTEIKQGSKLTLVTEEAVIICSVISVRARGACCTGDADPCEPLVVGVDPAVTGADKTVECYQTVKAAIAARPLTTPTKVDTGKLLTAALEFYLDPISSHSRQASRR